MAKSKKQIHPDQNSEIQDLLTFATEALQKGQAEKSLEALEKTEKLTVFVPGHFFTQGFLYAQLGKPEKAILALEKAAQIRPAVPEYQLLLGVQYLNSKKVPEAIKALEQATFLDPGKAKPYLSLASANMAAGKIPEGNKAFKMFVKRAFAGLFRGLLFRVHYGFGILLGVLSGIFLPNHPLKGALLLQKGKVLAKWNRGEKATQILQKGFEAFPGYAPLAAQLGHLLITQELYLNARSVTEAALEVNPRDFNLLCLWAKVNYFMGRMREAFEAMEKVEEKDRHRPLFSKTLGMVYYRNNEAAKALPLLKKVEKDFQNNPEFHNYLGRAYASMGKFEEAEAEFRKGLAANPGFGRPYINLAKMGKLLPGDENAKKVLAAIANPYTPQRQRCVFSFAAGFCYEKAKQYDDAFYYFQNGNRLRDVSYNRESWVLKVQERKAVFTKKYFQRTKAFGHKSKIPIFIVGMPRSGTTLTEQILAAHPRVFGAGERDVISIIAQDFEKQNEGGPGWPHLMNNVTRDQIGEMAQKYLNDIKTIAGDAERVIDKMPGNFWEVGLIATLFPNAKIIHCRRDPMDTCLSNYFQAYFTYHPYAFQLETLGHYYKLYQDMMVHWHKVLPGRILDMSYDETVAKPKEQIQKLLKFCDLEWHDDCLNFHKTKTTVKTASFAQVRKPIYKSSSKKWKLYEKHLGPLKAALK